MAKLIYGDGDSAEAEGRQTSEGSGAAVELKDKAGKDDQLEVNLDGAWYSATLSLGEDGSTTVHYDGYTDEEVDDQRWDAKQIKSFKPLRDHIRVFSKPLDDEECLRVRPKTIVCALRKAGSEKAEGWHDAVVKERRIERHTIGAEGSENCACSFTVEWLNGPEKGQGSILGCGEICLHSTKDVETHPLIVEILRHANQDDVGEKSTNEEQEEQEDSNEEGEWIPEEREEVRQFKRLKCKSTDLAQVKTELDAEQKLVLQENDRSVHVSPDAELENVPSLSHSSEQKGANKPSGKMRGQIPFLGANAVFWNSYPLPGASLKRRFPKSG